MNSRVVKFFWHARFGLWALATVIALAELCAPVIAQRGSITPFSDFVRNLSAARASEYVGHTAVQSTAAFEEMRDYLLGMYNGIVVTHSFAEDSVIFDCVPIFQQPSARGLTSIAKPPPNSPASLRQIANSASIPSQCGSGTIPMRRMTIEEVTRYDNLEDFLTKYGIPSALQLLWHKYAIGGATLQNAGGLSELSIWAPHVSRGQTFSLSQQWYGAPINCPNPSRLSVNCQTVEVGWINFPQKLSPSQLSVLFIYFTTNNYRTGCYNLFCKGFVQTNNTVTLGGQFSNYSSPGGLQWTVDLAYQFYQGNWWLVVNDTYVGYYPGALFGAGPMASGAQRIEFGGETAGTTSFPPMGTGQPASAGPQGAAYHNYIVYYNAKLSTFNPTLISRSTSACYSVTTNNCGSTDPNASCQLLFGGAGGSKC